MMQKLGHLWWQLPCCSSTRESCLRVVSSRRDPLTQGSRQFLKGLAGGLVLHHGEVLHGFREFAAVSELHSIVGIPESFLEFDAEKGGADLCVCRTVVVLPLLCARELSDDGVHQVFTKVADVIWSAGDGGG